MSRLDRLRRIAPKVLGAAFAASGSIHFVRPETFTGIIPRFLPAPEMLVYASGAAELVCAYGLFRGRRWSGLASALLLVAIFPANVQMLLDFQREYGPYSREAAIAWARLPLQLVLIWAAIQVGSPRED